ncbi:hypothetical protein E5329_02975 [Petralouisia muris]|jgi:hypothetical protein|uniref:Uncharacterized protein n=1 Tax=Petralouisia muris TaxID=3032872 RepID=A0AC61S0D5_9FIRM|nr:hypothetical protein [Petralouisia muris]TGY97829.1 hypothetical protein E5329_02975 [Petralouisia muris]
MGKDTRLVNIYIKIHNKHTLTIEDLKYLSKYDPECFEKTCRNLVYKMPETKEILQPEMEEPKELPKPQPIFEKLPTDKQKIEAVLSNLKQMEMDQLPVEEVNAEEVKELLGNLYMELLFPHNDRQKFFNMEDHEELSVFNKKV